MAAAAPKAGIKEKIIIEVIKIALPFLLRWLKQGVDYIFAKVLDILSKNRQKATERAEAKAHEAGAKEEAATDPLDAAYQRGRREAYEEQATQAQHDYQQLKAEVEHLRSLIQAQSAEQLTQLPNQNIRALGTPDT